MEILDDLRLDGLRNDSDSSDDAQDGELPVMPPPAHLRRGRRPSNGTVSVLALADARP